MTDCIILKSGDAKIGKYDSIRRKVRLLLATCSGQ
jgi:hypothetical protein